MMKAKRTLAVLLAVLLVTLLAPVCAFAATSVEVAVPVQLLLTGDSPPTVDVFTFQIQPENIANPMPANDTLVLNGAGSATFDDISFTVPGDYIYTITQTSTSLADYTYDTDVCTVTVRILSDSDGNLTASTWITKPSVSGKLSTAIFSNAYTSPGGTSPAEKGDLTITMDVIGTPYSADDVFDFTIVFSGDGSDRSYSYSGATTGVLYSGGSFSLKSGQHITLKDLPVGMGYTITLAAKPYYTAQPITNIQTGVISREGVVVPFASQYTPGSPAPVSVDPPVSKTISGDTPTSADTFTFELKADNASFPMPGGSSGGIKQMTIVGAGSQDFGYITYTVPNIYTYTAYEVNGGLPGYTYDTTIFTMKVVVTDVSGVLHATRTLERNGASVAGFDFVNQYQASVGSSPSASGSDMPDTGDSFQPLLWVGILLFSGFVILLLIFLRKKRPSQGAATQTAKHTNARRTRTK